MTTQLQDESTPLSFKLVAGSPSARADYLYVSLSKFAGLISCLDTAAYTLYNNVNTFIDGFHLTKGSGGGLFVVVNEVKLNNVLGLYKVGNSLLLLDFFPTSPHSSRALYSAIGGDGITIERTSKPL